MPDLFLELLGIFAWFFCRCLVLAFMIVLLVFGIFAWYLLQVFGIFAWYLVAGIWNFCRISFAGVLFCPPSSFCRYLELVSGIFYRCLDFLHDILLQVFGMGEAACHLPKLWRARPNFCTEWKLKVIRLEVLFQKHNWCLDQKTSLLYYRLESVSQVPAWIDDTVPFLLPEDDRSSSKGQGASYQGFTFTVRSFPILVEALGLHIPLLKNLATKSNSSEITVELTDSVSKQLIYHVSFNQSDLKTTKREAGYLYKDLKNR